jgi:hypothetical protein
MYADNGAALHQFIRRCHPEVNALFVLDDDAPNVDSARAFGPTIDSRSVEAYERGLLAEVHVITHGVHDVPTCSSARSRAVKVRVGHGLTALKRTKARAFHTNESANAIFDLIPVASAFELENKRTWGVPDSKLAITGLARFDTLTDKTERARAEDGVRVVYMPTWRDSLPVTETEFRATRFCRGVSDLLTSGALGNVLDRHGATLQVILHRGCPPVSRGVFSKLIRQNIELIEPNDPQDVFARSRALITDYSSVAWDFLYIDRPVVFYQFDSSEFDHVRGGYMDADLPGLRATTAEEAAAHLDHVLSGAVDETVASAVREWQRRAFAYRDANNCERVFGAIAAILRTSEGMPGKPE